MQISNGTILKLPRSLFPDQRGITGLETAIVLIAFVVVSSVFAFAALSTGLFSSDKAKETIQAGLAETRGSMELKGSVILTSSTTGTSGVVSDIAFQVANAAGGESIDLTPGKTIIKYTDDTQSKIFQSTSGFTVTSLGTADSDKLLERNEVYEVQLIDLETGTGTGVDTLTNLLQTNKTFSLEIIPPSGAVLFIERTTPVFLDSTTSLN
jgi:flagellin FlaB